MKLNKNVFLFLSVITLLCFAGITNVDAAAVCKATSGDGTKVGDEITCGTESFYVVSNDGSNIEMFAKYNLNVGYNWIQSGQSEALSGTIGIQNINCTANQGTIDGTVYAATCSEYATDENRASYFNNYSSYLKNKLGITGNITVIQPSMEWLDSVGCEHTVYQAVGQGYTEEVNCSESGFDFLYSTSYLLSNKISIYNQGTIFATDYATMYSGTGITSIRTVDFGAGYRPVVTISQTNLEETAVNNNTTTTEKDTNNKNQTTNKGTQTVDVEDTFKGAYVGYCIGTCILILGIMVVYQSYRKDKKEVQIKK